MPPLPARGAPGCRAWSAPAPSPRRSRPCARWGSPWTRRSPSCGRGRRGCSTGSVVSPWAPPRKHRRYRRSRRRSAGSEAFAAAFGIGILRRARGAHLRDLRREAAHPDLQLLLQTFGKRLVVLGPLGQADLLDIRVHVLGDRLIEVAGPSAAEQARGVSGVRHEGGALGHVVALLPEVHDVFVVGLAEVI